MDDGPLQSGYQYLRSETPAEASESAELLPQSELDTGMDNALLESGYQHIVSEPPFDLLNSPEHLSLLGSDVDMDYGSLQSACQHLRSKSDSESSEHLSEWETTHEPIFSPRPSPEPEPFMHSLYVGHLYAHKLTLHSSPTVSWTWNGSHPSGIAAEIKPGDVTVTSHRGNDITKTGTKEDPAVHS
jgi:hypothetical protein